MDKARLQRKIALICYIGTYSEYAGSPNNSLGETVAGILNNAILPNVVNQSAQKVVIGTVILLVFTYIGLEQYKIKSWEICVGRLCNGNLLNGGGQIAKKKKKKNEYFKC